MRKIRRMVSVVIISCMMAGCLAGCGSGRETGGTHGERQGTESRSGTERESIAERYRQKAIKEEFEENIAESGQSQQNMAVPECIEEEACDSVVSAADTYNSVMDSASNSEYVKIGYGESGYDTREYDYQEEHRFVSTKDSPLSTFAADCDTASYSNIRSYIEEGTLPPTGAVRVEEMINYFDYDYVSDPEAGKKFAVYTEYADCPWNKDTKLMMVGLNTAAIDMSEKKASNLVFLIDTSGSMYEENKLPLAQKAFKMLAENLDENDRISIVTYAGSDTLSELAADCKYLGTDIGYICILHTWGSTMNFHPHIHAIVLGGGLDVKNHWKDNGKDFFLPIKIISKTFRGKYMAELRQLWENDKLEFHGSAALEKIYPVF